MNDDRTVPANRVPDIAGRHFGFRDGELLAGGVPVRRIAEEYGTPLFVYDRDVIGKKLSLLENTLGSGFSVHYSVKANPSQEILRFFLGRGCGLEVASGGELRQGLEAGCTPERIVFAGPGKSPEELGYAVRCGIGEIHVESEDEIRRLEEIGRREGVRPRVSIRVNPSEDVQGGAMRMGGKPSPFGVDEERMEEVVARLSRSDTLEWMGVHLFTGTQILDYRVLVRQYRRGIEIAGRASAVAGKPLRTVDFGGGFGIPYFQGESELDMESFGRDIAPAIAEAKRTPSFRDAKFLVEPGRFLVGECGIYVTRVNTVKMSRGKKFLVVDGGLNHHLAASGNFGQVIKRNFPIAILNRMEEDRTDTADVVGPLCTPLDVLGRDVRMPKAEAGDLVGIFQSGAYGRSASPIGFLSHPYPPEIIAGEGVARLIRRRGIPDDYLAGQIPPDRND